MTSWWKIGRKSFLKETNETGHQHIERVLNLIVGLRVTEAGVKLSADTDCKELIAAANGQRIKRLFAFLLCEHSERKHLTLVRDSFTISSVTHTIFRSGRRRSSS